MVDFIITRNNEVTTRAGTPLGRLFPVGKVKEWIWICGECGIDSRWSGAHRDAARYLLEHREDHHPCLFCSFAQAGKDAIPGSWRQGSVFVFPDAYPVTPGHHLIIPIEHRRDYFDLTKDEREDTHTALETLDWKTRNYLGVPSRRLRDGGYNIGWNGGESAGQTVMHAHCHFIPRRDGDMENPAGGVRGVIPEKQAYSRK